MVNGAIILYLVYLSSDLISLLYDDSEKYALLDKDLTDVEYEEFEGDGTHKSPDRHLMIPKIIHQTYKNETIPSIWKDSQESCYNLHKDDYEYKFWTDEDARKFIQSNYEWFLPTFDAYPYPIMRADVIRYFVLNHYGGIYIDLDNGCTSKLDPLLAYPAWLRKTHPTGISNDLMGSIPNHEFFQRVIDSLQKYNRNWFVSYITIMFSTGPLFLSVMWKQYNRLYLDSSDDRLKVLIPPTESNDHHIYFFTKVQGSSWHLGDAQFMFVMGKYWIFFTILSTALVLGLLYLQFLLYQKLARFGLLRRILRSYIKTENGEGNYELLHTTSHHV